MGKQLHRLMVVALVAVKFPELGHTVQRPDLVFILAVPGAADRP